MKKELKSESFDSQSEVLRFCNKNDITIVSINTTLKKEYSSFPGGGLWYTSEFILFYYEN